MFSTSNLMCNVSQTLACRTDLKVSEKDEITHNLVITFRKPYADDKLIWVDEKKKSLGYSLKNGKKIKRINKANISKKIR